jgi:CubicO group peptidase (beta-lactamase class C family)
MARFGQLLLQDGWSGARSLVPRPWIAEATRRHAPWTIAAGPIEHLSYGLLWWVDLDRDAWFAWGHGGQFVYVVPSLELVLVATTLWQGIGIEGDALAHRVLEVFVDGVLPAVGPPPRRP